MTSLVLRMGPPASDISVNSFRCFQPARRQAGVVRRSIRSKKNPQPPRSGSWGSEISKLLLTLPSKELHGQVSWLAASVLLPHLPIPVSRDSGSIEAFVAAHSCGAAPDSHRLPVPAGLRLLASFRRQPRPEYPCPYDFLF